MRKLRRGAWICISLFIAIVPAALAQQQTQSPESQQSQQSQKPQDQPAQPTQPIQAYHSPLAVLGGHADETTSQDLLPDTRSLAGVLDFSLGFPLERRSYWQPYLSLNATADSNPLGITSSPGWVGYSSVLGGIEVRKFSGISDLVLSYIGGGSFSNAGSVGNFVTQQFAFAEKISLHRLNLSLLDQFDYIPEAGFGYEGLSGSLLPEGGTIGLQNSFLFGQSILTARGQRAANTSIGQADLLISPRSTLTFAGGYSFLHFFDNNLLNSGDIIFQAGYSQQFGPENALGAIYRFNGYRYGGVSQSINDNTVYLSYGRRLTGRLALRLAAGPELAYFQTPITGVASGDGAPTSGTSATTNRTLVTYSVSTSLAYSLARTSLGLGFDRGVSDGSGVLAGAITDTVRASVGRQLSRTFSGKVNFGYSRNNGLAIVTASTPANGTQIYDYWFGGVSVAHPFGRTADCFLSYQTQYQTSNSSFCIGPTCQTSVVRQIISMGFNWRAHPTAF
jgi:hypothetical protein